MFVFYTLKNIGIDVLFICIHKIYLILCPFVHSFFHLKLTLLSIFLNVMLLQQKEDWTRLATSNGGFKALYTPASFLEKKLFYHIPTLLYISEEVEGLLEAYE